MRASIQFFKPSPACIRIYASVPLLLSDMVAACRMLYFHNAVQLGPTVFFDQLCICPTSHPCCVVLGSSTFPVWFWIWICPVSLPDILHFPKLALKGIHHWTDICAHVFRMEGKRLKRGCLKRGGHTFRVFFGCDWWLS